MDEEHVIGRVDNCTWTRLPQKTKTFPVHQGPSHLANNRFSVGMRMYHEVRYEMTQCKQELKTKKPSKEDIMYVLKAYKVNG